MPYGRWAFELRLVDETGPEMPATVALLAEQGIDVADTHPVARFARTTDEERPHETIVFFHELGPDRSLDGILERGRAAFTLLHPAA